MLRTILWFAYFWIIQLVLLVFLAAVTLMDLLGFKGFSQAFANKLAYLWAKSMVILAGAKVKVSGQVNLPSGPVLFVANHQGNFDIPLLLGYINKPKGFIAKKELKKMPLISIWMKKINCVFVDRGNLRQIIKEMAIAANKLALGNSLVVFPEGTRSRGPVMKAFKKGSIKIALETGVPIIPVAIKGSYKLMEAQGNRIKSAPVEIVVMEPIYTQGLSREDEIGLCREIEEKIRAEVEGWVKATDCH